MRKQLLISISALLLAFSVTTKAQISQHPDVASNLTLLEAWIEAQLAYRDLPGVSIAVVHDQELVYSKGFGYADVEANVPAAPDTIYRIASHSKLFAAISILQLRDQGKMSLDEPIQTYLPWFQIQNPFDNSRATTLRQILTHTSGLPREAGSEYWIDFDFPTLDQVMNRLPEQTMIFPPETQWKYSNLALTLAGEAIANVSGQSFADYVQENIIDELGMEDTSVVFPDDHRLRLAAGYGRLLPDGSRERFPFIDAVSMAAATGVSSTVEDMARFVSWQFRLRDSEDAGVLDGATLREMQRVHWIEPDWDWSWGLGFQIIHTEARDLVGHSGGYPGYRTATFISPQEKVGVIVFTNGLDAEPYPGDPRSISDRVFEWLSPAIQDAVNGVAGVSADPSWKKLEGTYRSIWEDVHILYLDGQLTMINPASPNPKEGALKLEPLTENTFRIVGKGFGELGETATFEIGSSGQVERLYVGENPHDPISYDIE